jgi:Ribosomal protein S21
LPRWFYVRDNDINAALRILKRKMQREATFREIKQRQPARVGHARCRRGADRTPGPAMTLRPPFRPLRPDLDKFLFEMVGDEVEGIPPAVNFHAANRSLCRRRANAQ